MELDEDDIILTLVDYDDNGIFTFTGIEKDTAGNIIKFSSGKYLESGFTNESTDALNQMPTVGVVTLEKVAAGAIGEPQDEFPDALVIKSGLLSGDWTVSGRIFRVKKDDENQIFPNYSTTINITQNSSYPEFLVVESGGSYLNQIFEYEAVVSTVLSEEISDQLSALSLYLPIITFNSSIKPLKDNQFEYCGVGNQREVQTGLNLALSQAVSAYNFLSLNVNDKYTTINLEKGLTDKTGIVKDFLDDIQKFNLQMVAFLSKLSMITTPKKILGIN